MILSTLMAAAITVGTLQADNNPTWSTTPVGKQAELMTYTLLVCRPHLPPTVWDSWLPLAFELGIDSEDINTLREYLVEDPVPVEPNETICLRMVNSQLDKLKSLQEQEQEQEQGGLTLQKLNPR